MVCGQVFRIMAWRLQHETCQRYSVPPPGAHNPVSLCAEHPSPSQDSEHYLAAFYGKLSVPTVQFFAVIIFPFSNFYLDIPSNKLSAAADLFFWHQDPHGAKYNEKNFKCKSVKRIHFWDRRFNFFRYNFSFLNFCLDIPSNIYILQMKKVHIWWSFAFDIMTWSENMG